jgi:hypothetical protein
MKVANAGARRMDDDQTQFDDPEHTHLIQTTRDRALPTPERLNASAFA